MLMARRSAATRPAAATWTALLLPLVLLLLALAVPALAELPGGASGPARRLVRLQQVPTAARTAVTQIADSFEPAEEDLDSLPSGAVGAISNDLPEFPPLPQSAGGAGTLPLADPDAPLLDLVAASKAQPPKPQAGSPTTTVTGAPKAAASAAPIAAPKLDETKKSGVGSPNAVASGAKGADAIGATAVPVTVSGPAGAAPSKLTEEASDPLDDPVAPAGETAAEEEGSENKSAPGTNTAIPSAGTNVPVKTGVTTTPPTLPTSVPNTPATTPSADKKPAPTTTGTTQAAGGTQTAPVPPAVSGPAATKDDASEEEPVTDLDQAETTAGAGTNAPTATTPAATTPATATPAATTPAGAASLPAVPATVPTTTATSVAPAASTASGPAAPVAVPASGPQPHVETSLEADAESDADADANATKPKGAATGSLPPNLSEVPAGAQSLVPTGKPTPPLPPTATGAKAPVVSASEGGEAKPVPGDETATVTPSATSTEDPEENAETGAPATPLSGTQPPAGASGASPTTSPVTPSTPSPTVSAPSGPAAIPPLKSAPAATSGATQPSGPAGPVDPPLTNEDDEESDATRPSGAAASGAPKSDATAVKPTDKADDEDKALEKELDDLLSQTSGGAAAGTTTPTKSPASQPQEPEEPEEPQEPKQPVMPTPPLLPPTGTATVSGPVVTPTPSGPAGAETPASPSQQQQQTETEPEPEPKQPEDTASEQPSTDNNKPDLPLPSQSKTPSTPTEEVVDDSKSSGSGQQAPSGPTNIDETSQTGTKPTPVAPAEPSTHTPPAPRDAEPGEPLDGEESEESEESEEEGPIVPPTLPDDSGNELPLPVPPTTPVTPAAPSTPVTPVPPATPKPKAMCRPTAPRLDFTSDDKLRLNLRDFSIEDCETPGVLRAFINMHQFRSGNGDSAAARNRACAHVVSISSKQLESAADDAKGTVLLNSAGQALVPGFKYFVDFESCPSIANRTGCVSIPAAISGDTLMRPEPTPHMVDSPAVRVLVATPFASSSQMRKHLEQDIDLNKLHLAADEIAAALVQSLADGERTLRSLPKSRLLVSFDMPSENSVPPLVRIDVLPPFISDDETDDQEVAASEIAERLRCLLKARQAAAAAHPDQPDTSLLALLDEVRTMTTFDPCTNKDSESCRRVQGSAAPPVAPVTPTPTGFPSGPSKPNTPSGPAEDPEDWSHGEFPGEQPQPPRATPVPQKPLPPIGPDHPSPLPTSTPSGALGGNNDDDALLDDLSGPSPPRSPTAPPSQWFHSLADVNPMLVMLLVGGALGLVFWAACIRNSSSARRTETAASDNGDLDMPDVDEELGGVEMAHGNKKGGFAPLSNMDDDSSPAGLSSSGIGSGSSLGSVSTPASGSGSGAFANEREEGSASKFLVSVLIGIGIPSFGTAKYSQVLKDNYLSSIHQLKQLDNSDWKRLGLPLVIEEAVRKTLNEHTNREGRFSSGGIGGAQGDKRVAKGLDLKAATKKPIMKGGSSSSSKSGLSVSALSPGSLADDPFDDPQLSLDGPDDEADPDGSSSSGGAASAPRKPSAGRDSSQKKKKGGKDGKKPSLLLAPPANDAPAAAASSTANDDIDDVDKLDDDWLSKF